MKRLIFLTLILSSFFASGQTHYYGKSLRFSSPTQTDSAYNDAKLFMNYSSGKLRIHWGDSTSTVWPAVGLGIADSTGVAGSFTPVRIPFSVGPTTLSDSYALTWDTTNLAVGIKNTRMFSIDKSARDDIYWGQGAGNFTTTGVGGNTGIGYVALEDLTDGFNNTAIGADALKSVTTGDNNVAISNGSGGEFVTTGSNNVFIADDTSANTDYQLFIAGLLRGKLSETNRYLDIRGYNGSENTIFRSLYVSRQPNETPATGIGTGIGFNVQTGAVSVQKVIAAIDAVTTDVSTGSVDGDLVLSTMAAGATAAERVRISSTGTTIAGTPSITMSSAGDFIYPNTQTAALDFNDGTTTHLNIDSSNDEVEVPVNLAIGTTSASSRLDVVSDNAATNTSTTIAEFVSTSTGTPAAGKGANIHLMAETAAANVESGAIIDAVFSDVTSTTEAADLNVRAMSNGVITNTRHFIQGKRVTLTESSATTIATIALGGTGNGGGGRGTITVVAADANDVQARTLDFSFAMINDAGGGLSTNLSTPVETIITASGTLTATITLTVSGSNILVQVNAVSSLTQTTLYANADLHLTAFNAGVTSN